MPDALIFNIVCLPACFIFFYMFWPKHRFDSNGEHAVAAFGFMMLVFYISVAVWTIYVLHHFLTKYW